MYLLQCKFLQGSRIKTALAMLVVRIYNALINKNTVDFLDNPIIVNILLYFIGLFIFLHLFRMPGEEESLDMVNSLQEKLKIHLDYRFISYISQ